MAKYKTVQDVLNRLVSLRQYCANNREMWSGVCQLIREIEASGIGKGSSTLVLLPNGVELPLSVKSTSWTDEAGSAEVWDEIEIDGDTYKRLEPVDLEQAHAEAATESYAKWVDEQIAGDVKAEVKRMSDELNKAYLDKLPYLVKASRAIHEYLVNTDKIPVKLIGMQADLGAVLGNPPFMTMTCDDVDMGDLYSKPSDFKNGNWADNTFDYFDDLFDNLFRDISGEKPPDYTMGVVTAEGVIDG